jgi:carboxypeptidase C (cathepsin A)
MVNWLKIADFSPYKGRDLYLFGESYGGHWVPQIGNRHYTAQNPDINLKGVAIGNGWTTPHSHMKTMIDYAKFANTVVTDPVVFTKERIAYMEDRYNLAAFWSNGQYVSPLEQKNKNIPKSPSEYVPEWNPELGISPFNIMWGNIGYMGEQIDKFNFYNIKTKCEGALCYNLDKLYNTFNGAEYRQALNIDSRSQWEFCNR